VQAHTHTEGPPPLPTMPNGANTNSTPHKRHLWSSSVGRWFLGIAAWIEMSFPIEVLV
jgi:hypothetical protein